MTFRFSLSTWSLHSLLGSAMYLPHGPTVLEPTDQSELVAPLDLLHVPAAMAEREIRTLELCHFHLPRRDDDYLAELRAAIEDAGVELFSVLIDHGDITQPDEAQRVADLKLNKGWIDIAAKLGATHVRIDGGKQEPSEITVARSVAGLDELAAHARQQGVSAITENWHATTKQPDVLPDIHDRCREPVGLCVDFGNANGTADKHETIARLMPRATSIHAKAEYDDDGELNVDDLHRSVDVVRQHDFNGPMSLIYSEAGDRWPGIEKLRQAIADRMQLNAAVE